MARINVRVVQEPQYANPVPATPKRLFTRCVSHAMPMHGMPAHAKGYAVGWSVSVCECGGVSLNTNHVVLPEPSLTSDTDVTRHLWGYEVWVPRRSISVQACSTTCGCKVRFVRDLNVGETAYIRSGAAGELVDQHINRVPGGTYDTEVRRTADGFETQRLSDATVKELYTARRGELLDEIFGEASMYHLNFIDPIESVQPSYEVAIALLEKRHRFEENRLLIAGCAVILVTSFVLMTGFNPFSITYLVLLALCMGWWLRGVST